MIHYFPCSPDLDDLPVCFPDPFSNSPHPLAKQAALLLQQSLRSPSDWQHDFDADDGGKMLGVLVVCDEARKIGFIAGFSGMLAGQWQLPGFVPPVFDISEQAVFLSSGEQGLQQLALEIQCLEESQERCELLNTLLCLQGQRDQALDDLCKRKRQAKVERKQQRVLLQDIADDVARERRLSLLSLASCRDKREIKETRKMWADRVQLLQVKLDVIEQQILVLKKQRTDQSRILHKKIRATYRLTNRLLEQRAMTDFFVQGLPPAGAGDCAGPKLLYYAHQHKLRPIALAEFWWGTSPSGGVRHHAHFYPACRGKCRPILPFMLRGLEVQAEAQFGLNVDLNEPRVVYEDDVLLVLNKPSGLLSVPGKVVSDSVYTRLQQRYADCPELTLVHRLDMATSGLLLVAKNRRTHKALQKQFLQRSIEKRYVALLDRVLAIDQLEGVIDLPLRVDLDDRPRQQVCYEHGKLARTRWRVIAQEDALTRVWFYPETGRTHQLRVHASHRDGLNAAIVGDGLYGKDAERLMLHAERLCFTHPLSFERLEIEVEAPF
ncbi:MAG: RluA family pseudouridine synthase [Gammaproteobacteria bacterium]|nr:RluA family pseudouridine synthase [Gammaproteobacteria bacterium]